MYSQFGYAVRCEAVASPRRRGVPMILGYALEASIGPINFKGIERTKGLAPE
jgi:hypothetical protein